MGTLPDRWLRVGDSAGVEVGEAFVDPEGDALTYGAGSSATGVATASASGTRVTIDPVGAGTATITVTATDAGGSGASAMQAFEVTVRSSSAVDYDADDDGLIDITTLARLDAVRHDLDGDGVPTADGAAAYAAAFSTVGDRQACGGLTGCVGYELGADLDFDTNGNGRADAGDTYWNAGAGWEPLGYFLNTIGPVFFFSSFKAIFEGNGHTLANLFIDRGALPSAGLFGGTSRESVIRRVGVIDVAVAGEYDVGGLVGDNGGTVFGSYATGAVSGTEEGVGGLVGRNSSSAAVAASYAAVEVTGTEDLGGLVGASYGTVTASYATGRVAGEKYVGGLVGFNRGTITASYATGAVWGKEYVGGLTGTSFLTVTAGYWDTTTSRITSGSGGQGRTTALLQAPTGYTGIYAQWNVDVVGDDAGDSPWHFGTDAQYPALSIDFDGAGGATWQEFGRQLRGGPTLTATDTVGRNAVSLSWTAADASHWTPAPAVAYTVTQDDGTAVTVVADGISGTTATDTAVVSGGTYTWQVSATAGGAATHSAPKSVTVVGNRPPTVAGTLANRTLPVEDGPVDVDVAMPAVFSDPDNDVLTYGAVSSAPAVASVSVSGSTVTVTPLSGGMATITVTATDVGGSNTPAAQTFVVTVPNRSPVAVGTLADRSVQVSDGVFTVPVGNAFRDPDGDALTYGASSSDASVASATALRSTVSVTPLSGGTATVTVTATDVGGSNTSAMQTFTVTVANRSLEARETGANKFCERP